MLGGLGYGGGDGIAWCDREKGTHDKREWGLWVWAGGRDMLGGMGLGAGGTHGKGEWVL